MLSIKFIYFSNKNEAKQQLNGREISRNAPVQRSFTKIIYAGENHLCIRLCGAWKTVGKEMARLRLLVSK